MKSLCDLLKALKQPGCSQSLEAAYKQSLEAAESLLSVANEMRDGSSSVTLQQNCEILHKSAAEILEGIAKVRIIN